MNLVCDQVIPYLVSSGIAYTRNDRNQSASAAIRQANAGNYGLYVAMHSNAAPEGQYGSKRGCDIYYYQYGRNSQRAAELFADNLRAIYPLPQYVRTVPTTTLGEVVRSRAPAVLLEIGFHDNVSDANWIKGNISRIARAVASGITAFFALPLAMPQAPQRAQVSITSGTLNIRSRPSTSSPILASAPNGSRLTVVGTLDGWYVVRYGSVTGYAAAPYVNLL
jgi:N-acetylmuramoyl-L-alanine amidase